PHVKSNVSALSGPWPAYVFFFSICDGRKRAEVLTVTGPTFADVWRDGVQSVSRLAASKKINPRWLRVDWVEHAEELTWRALHGRLAATKRNYFRCGISLDSAFRHAFLETELNANAMLYEGGFVKNAPAVLNVRNFRRYAALRHGLHDLDFPDEAKVQVFSTRAAFTSSDSPEVHVFNGTGRNGGRRWIDRLTPENVLRLIEDGSSYLATQGAPEGRFNSGWHPCFDRPINTYNSLRHASTVYSMVEAWEVTGDPELKAAIDRALDYLTGVLTKSIELGSAR